MDFIQETKQKAADAAIFFKRAARPFASLAVVGVAATMLQSCQSANTYGSFTNVRMSQRTTTVSPDGRTRTTTSMSQEFDLNDMARAARNFSGALQSGARGIKTLREAFD